MNEQQINIAIDFVNYCYEHEVDQPTRIDFDKFWIQYGPEAKGEFKNYYSNYRAGARK